MNDFTVVLVISTIGLLGLLVDKINKLNILASNYERLKADFKAFKEEATREINKEHAEKLTLSRKIIELNSSFEEKLKNHKQLVNYFPEAYKTSDYCNYKIIDNLSDLDNDSWATIPTDIISNTVHSTTISIYKQSKNVIKRNGKAILPELGKKFKYIEVCDKDLSYPVTENEYNIKLGLLQQNIKLRDEPSLNSLIQLTLIAGFSNRILNPLVSGFSQDKFSLLFDLSAYIEHLKWIKKGLNDTNTGSFCPWGFQIRRLNRGYELRCPYMEKNAENMAIGTITLFYNEGDYDIRNETVYFDPCALIID